MPTKIPICYRCKHFKKVDKCFAFMDKIPDTILYGQDKHSKPLPEQDNNIVFEAIEEDR